jgi:hypothetical protein
MASSIAAFVVARKARLAVPSRWTPAGLRAILLATKHNCQPSRVATVEAKVVLLDRVHCDEDLSSVQVLDARNVDSRGFSEILERSQATDLRIYHIKIGSLDGIDCLHSVTTLRLEWANKVTSLRPVYNMSGLCELQIVDFSRLENVAGIEKLTGLRRLVLAGGVWKPLRLASIRPVASIHDLQELTLLNTHLEDDDITCLAALRHLKSLTLSNQFDRAQVAMLARHLNPQLSAPLGASIPSHLTCPSCSGTKHMFAGRRMPFLCPTCERARFDRLTHEFEAIVRGS